MNGYIHSTYTHTHIYVHNIYASYPNVVSLSLSVSLSLVTSP